MHVLKVMYPRAEVPFYFKTMENGAAAYETLVAAFQGDGALTHHALSDSFNRQGLIDLAEVIGITFMDVEDDLKAQIELALLQSQATQAAQRRANGSPNLIAPGSGFRQ